MISSTYSCHDFFKDLFKVIFFFFVTSFKIFGGFEVAFDKIIQNFFILFRIKIFH